MVASALTVEALLAGIGGGILGAAIGALPALSLAGLVVIVGEATALADESLSEGTAIAATLDGSGLTATVGLGPALGPHAAFAGGVAAAAYLGRREMFDTTFRYHPAKGITKPLGSHPAVLLVGGTFGLLGVVIAGLAAEANLPVDPIFLAVVVSAFVHRLAFGYKLLGRLDEDILDMSRQEERWGERETAQAAEGRQRVEPWQPDHYEWENVAVLGAGVGLVSGYIALVSASAFLAFGVAAASLGFLAAGLYDVPVTHHMALPASIAALAVSASDPGIAMVVGGLFGLLGGVLGELAQRIVYAHGDTHVDPAAVSIVLTSLFIAILVAGGVFNAGPVPYPTL
jgi:hypothetical protein